MRKRVFCSGVNRWKVCVATTAAARGNWLRKSVLVEMKKGHTERMPQSPGNSLASAPNKKKLYLDRLLVLWGWWWLFLIGDPLVLALPKARRI